MSQASTILIVDDDTNVADIARRLLQRALPDLRIATAPSGAAALIWLESQAADVVIADLTMPEMNGVELAAAIAVRWPHIRLILMSGDAAGVVAHDRVPIAGYLAKPFNGAALAQVVHMALANR